MPTDHCYRFAPFIHHILCILQDSESVHKIQACLPVITLQNKHLWDIFPFLDREPQQPRWLLAKRDVVELLTAISSFIRSPLLRSLYKWLLNHSHLARVWVATKTFSSMQTGTNDSEKPFHYELNYNKVANQRISCGPFDGGGWIAVELLNALWRVRARCTDKNKCHIFPD